MAEQLTHDPKLAPAAEVVHMPEPSFLPIVLAFGLLLALGGILMNTVISAIGVIIALVAFIRWVGQTRREMAELPLEH
jgi:uncharacterized membrane protein (DUF485 family)